MKEKIGKITHYFSHIGVAVVEIEKPLHVGDKISIEGSTTNFQQTVDSMQIEHDKIQEAKPGQAIGLKVNDRVREGDVVFKID